MHIASFPSGRNGQHELLAPANNEKSDLKIDLTSEKHPSNVPAPGDAGQTRPVSRWRSLLGYLAVCALFWLYFFDPRATSAHPRKHQHDHSDKSIQGYADHLGSISGPLSASPLRSGHRWSEWFARLERDFLAVPSASGARDALQRYTNVSHYAGTPADFNSALQILEEWGTLVGALLPKDLSEVVFEAGSPESQAYLKGVEGHDGVRAWTDTYAVWLNQPINSTLTLAKPEKLDEPYWKAKLEEDVLEKDPTSSRGVPLFHGYSASGSVSGPVVFAGMGRKEDFADLAAHGINVKGKVVLVNYGSNFRGLKVRAAQEAGAVGVIIYTDTIEDGEITEANGYTAYPDGPARHPSSVQRGSVQGLSFYPGDPSTPGKPSYKNATRLQPEDADSLPKIPSLPLSYREAKVLLEAIKGKGVKASEVNDRLAGAIDGVEYWTGPSEDVVHLENFVDMKVRDIWNTYAVLPGRIQDEVVIVGNHRDAWTFGAADPNSGTAAFHEAIKGLGQLYANGWRPLRTIVFASWDAEEYGLVGSTEFGEDYAKWIQDHVVAYHNVDVSVSGGRIQSASSASLSRFVQDIAAKVDNPNHNSTKIQLDGFHPLGSGSDYTVFLQHLGIASTDLGFKRNDKDPIYMYHSNFDSFYWMDKFGDPGFKRHEAAARIVGLMALETSSRLFAPVNVGDYADELTKYLAKIERLAEDELGIPGGVGARHPLWMVRLRVAVAKLEAHAKAFEVKKMVLLKKLRLLAGWKRGCRKHDKHREKEIHKVLAEVRKVNKKLQSFEQGFISKEGLKGRQWYKHLGTAPGRWLGYGATTFPGVTEAITLDGGKGLEAEAKRLTMHIEKLAKHLRH